jgi:hypothetical protein
MSNKKNFKKNDSTTVSLSTEFKAAASLDGDGALAFMLVSAFGVSLGTLMILADKIAAAEHGSVVMLALTAGVQVRGNVVFVGADHGGIKQAYPELIIDGQRQTGDQFNFGALHALGHVFAHAIKESVGPKIISKSGSCITGEKLTESDAGVINKEIFASWTTEDKGAYSAWFPVFMIQHGPFLDSLAKTIPQLAAGFASKVKAPAGPVVARVGKKAEKKPE